MEQLLSAVSCFKEPVSVHWPNIDSSSDLISKVIRRLRETLFLGRPFSTQKHLEPEAFLRVLDDTPCAVGNSSAFVREAGMFGTPVVLVGSRQDGREWHEGVMQVAPKANEIHAAIRAQLNHGRYNRSTTYGTPGISKRIADALESLDTTYKHKRLAY